MRNISVLIGEVHEEVKVALEEILEPHKSFDILNKTKNPSVLLDFVKTQHPQLVFLSVDLMNQDMNAYDICGQILVSSPTTIVIMTSIYEKPSEVREAMRAGARDIVGLSEMEERLAPTIVELVERIRVLGNSQSRDGKVISFVSPKGGVGKSTSVINLAADLAARRHDNGEHYRVLVLDYDLEFGDIAHLSDIKSKRNIYDLNEMMDIDIDAIKAHFFDHEEYGYSILSAPTSPQYADIIRPDILKRTIQLARKIYDYVLIDTSQGFKEPSIVAMEESDLILLVSGGQMLDVKNMKIMIKTITQIFGQEFADKHLSILLTQYTKNCVPANEINNRFQINVLGTIPSDENTVAQANNFSKAVSRENPNTPVAKSYKEVTARLEHMFNPKEIVEDNKPKERRGILSALFKK